MACCFENCSNTRKKNPNLTFFRFPKEKERRYLWMKKCNNASIQNLSFEELQNRVVCEEHFLPKCFDYSILTSGKTRRSLFKFAVPQPASVIAASKPDLVSPQSLMNITENMCLLVPPISPSPPFISASDSGDNSDWSIKAPIQDKEDEHSYSISEEAEANCLGLSKCSIVSSTLTTSTITMTTANTSTSVTSVPCSLSFHSKDWKTKKYKKILPKQEIIVAAENIVLNLRCLNITKLEKAPKGTSTSKTTTLLLDDNLLQTLPTIDSYSRLSELSLSNNEIDSFIWFGRLTSLRTLNLSRNKITEIDGLWKLRQLTRVDLSGNLIEVVRCRSNDTKCNLEYLDISDNKISLVENMSTASKLKELFLHKNQIKIITNLKSYLPQSLQKLTLAENSILSLADMWQLSDLKLLKELTIMKNMCVNVLQLVDLQGNSLAPPRSFNYRPFVAAVCTNLATLDFKPISESEKLKATWLLSQEQFKQISLHNHTALICYLSDVCPLSQTAFEGELLKERNEDNVQTIQTQSQNNLKSTVLNRLSVNECSKNTNTSEFKFHKPCKLRAKKSLKSKKKATSSNFKETKRDCMTPYPCKHYIELIEERAKNHKLKRSNETLTQENMSLCQRLQILETTLEENDINIRDVFMKIEIEDEDAT